MTVYVDDMFRKATVPNGARSVTGEWCHMQADTRDELDAMADKIGLRRSWIQYPDDDVKRHYDVTRPRRAAAVAAGAVEIGMLDLSRLRRKWRAERIATQVTDRAAILKAMEPHSRFCAAWTGVECSCVASSEPSVPSSGGDG